MICNILCVGNKRLHKFRCYDLVRITDESRLSSGELGIIIFINESTCDFLTLWIVKYKAALQYSLNQVMLIQSHD